MNNFAKRLTSLIWVVFVLILPLTCYAQQKASEPEKYPSKPIEMIIPYAAGGMNDILGRAVANVAEESFKTRFVVVNKAGGSSLVGGLFVTKSKPDGYTIAMMPPGTAWPEAYFKTPPYKSTDLEAVCQVCQVASALYVKADAPVKTIGELIKYFKSNPNAKWGVNGISNNPQLVGVALFKQTDVKNIAVPFGGDADLLTGVLGGHVFMGAGTIASIMPQVQGGNIRVLTVFSDDRVAALKDVPTINELGYNLDVPKPDNTFYVPKGTPREKVKYLDELIAKVLKDPKFISLMYNVGINITYVDHDSYVTEQPKKVKRVHEILQDLRLLK